MPSEVFGSQVPVQTLVEQILVSRRITDIDRYQLKLLLLAASVSQEDRILLDRVFYGVRKGLLRVEVYP